MLCRFQSQVLFLLAWLLSQLLGDLFYGIVSYYLTATVNLVHSSVNKNQKILSQEEAGHVSHWIGVQGFNSSQWQVIFIYLGFWIVFYES